MLTKSLLILCFPSVNPPFSPIENKYADSIPYESLYQIDSTPNKNTLEYNTMTTEELVRIQNQKILKELENSIKNNK